MENNTESVNDPNTFMLDEWVPIKTIIQQNNIAYKIMDLHYDENNGFMNGVNIPKFQSSATKEPILIGFNDVAKKPFMIIRFIDANRNKQDNIPEGATSFLIITVAYIAHVGFEYCLEEINWMNDPITGNCVGNRRFEMNLDNGTAITDYVTKLLKGEFEHKTLK